MEKFVICNSSPLDADVSLCFLNDSKGDIYLLDPPTMFLKPSERQVAAGNSEYFILSVNVTSFYI